MTLLIPLAQARVYDAAIVGGGAAGASAAIALARAGRSVLLLEKRSQEGFKLGESLPPLALNMVKQLLGPLDEARMIQLGMSKTQGNLSCWQSHRAETQDFFVSPPGYGLRLDRPAFDRALRDTAQKLGVELIQGISISDIAFGMDLQTPCRLRGRLTDRAEPVEFQAHFLIDCSGRQSLVAKAAGVERVQQDRLFAYALRFTAEHGRDQDALTRIEAGPQGWWYSARLDSQQRLLVFHTDEDLDAAKLAGTIEGFLGLFEQSQHLKALIREQGYQPSGKLLGAPACGAQLAQPFGERWLATGDAAQSFDPLSSQGIYQALRTGFMAGQSVGRALAAESSATQPLKSQAKSYADCLAQIWAEYRKYHQYYYSCQPRWPGQAFWQRRQTQNLNGNSYKNIPGNSATSRVML